MSDEKHYAIYRHQKVKTLNELKGRSEHNSRRSKQGLEHIDDTKPANLIFGEDDAVSLWHTKAEAAGISSGKLRKNAVVAIESIATTSPGWWDTATQDEKDEWLETSRDFLIEKAGGADNVLSIHFHEDESTPHLQALSIPLITKEMKPRGRRKKGAPPPEPYTKTVLAAGDIVGGDRAKMVDWQTEYAAKVGHLGLHRGRPRKETGARNLAPSKYRAEKARELEEQQRATEAAQAAEVAALTKERKANDTLDMSRTEAQRVITTADERAEALHIGYEAIDTGELAYRPATQDKPDGLVAKRAKQDSVLPPKGDAFTRFTAAVQPYVASLKGYAKRLYALTQKEKAMDEQLAFLASTGLLDEAKQRVIDAEARRRVKDKAITSMPTSFDNEAEPSPMMSLKDAIEKAAKAKPTTTSKQPKARGNESR